MTIMENTWLNVLLPRGYDFYVEGISYADGGGVDKLPANLKKRLDKANSIIVKYNGKPISEAEAIRFNADQMPQSGYNGGLKAFRFSNAKGFENANKRDYQTIGDALIDISRKMSGKDIYAAGGGNVSDLDYSDILAVLEDKLTESVANDIPNDFENCLQCYRRRSRTPIKRWIYCLHRWWF
jgi:hypothetical protein